jgi:3-methyladenine DNA glycosylase/8-oxoguanine DNA glycosylase
VSVQLRSTVAVKNGGKWLPTGSVITVAKDEARKLIERGQAKPIDDGNDIDPDIDPQGSAVEALCKLDGVNKKVADLLIAAGYDSPDALRNAEVGVDELVEIEGIGAKTADRIIDALNDDDDE